MNTLYNFWGQGEHLTVLQMTVRASVSFFITLLLIRIGGVRIFGKRSGFDTIIMITMGSVLARGIVGASPYMSTVAAATAMIIIHWLLGWLSDKSQVIECLIKGRRTLLYSDGAIIHKNLVKTSLTKTDLMESLRLEIQTESLDNVEKAFMETNGRISFIMKNDIHFDKLSI